MTFKQYMALGLRELANKLDPPKSFSVSWGDNTFYGNRTTS